MTAAGCAINASAIYKIEQGDPPRRITVDELVGFSRVFGEPLADLVVAPELVAHRNLWPLLEDWRALLVERLNTVQEIDARLDEIRDRIRRVAKDMPGGPEVIGAWWADLTAGDTDWLDRIVEFFAEGSAD